MSRGAKLAVDGGPPVRHEMLPLLRVSVGDEERQQIQSVLDAGVFCSVFPQATKVKALESAFARYVGTKHAVAFSSGTTAQHASLTAIGVGPGDEVIVPPLTFISTAYTVLLRGATVVFADVDADTLVLDPEKVRDKITPRTRVIVPVHWFGHPVDMDPLLALAKEHGLTVIEDCAHAYGTVYHGRKAGTMGAMACWSLQESKLITAAGEGGMLTTDDDHFAQQARMTRDHGKSQKKASKEQRYHVVEVGNNYRMTEIQAAFALAQLGKIDEFQSKRRAHSEYMDAALSNLPDVRRPSVHTDVNLSYSYYPIRFLREHVSVELRQISRSLEAEGIGNYAIAADEMCHMHPIFAERAARHGQQYGAGALPIAEHIASELLILPLYPDLTQGDVDDIVAAVAKVVRATAR